MVPEFKSNNVKTLNTYLLNISDDQALSELNLMDEVLYFLIRARRNRPEVTLKLVNACYIYLHKHGICIIKLLLLQLKTVRHYKTEQYPELFNNITAQSIQSVLDNRMIGVVKRVNDEGPALIVFKTGLSLIFNIK